MSRRCVLFAPGDRPELCRKAPTMGADVVAFDLEDAVTPRRKDEARMAVRDLLSDPSFDPDPEVVVRIASPTDLETVLTDSTRLDAVGVPKAESPDAIDDVVAVAEANGGRRPIFAFVETPAGVLNAPAIARHDAVDALVFGAEDFAAAVGATRTLAGEEVSYARQRVLVAARAAGVDAIDTLHTDYEDDEGLRTDTETTVRLGYDGKLAIHPRQVPIINDVLTPDPERIDWAQRVLDARDDAAADERGVFSVDGEMIDAPLIAQAERIVARAAAAGTQSDPRE